METTAHNGYNDTQFINCLPRLPEKRFVPVSEVDQSNNIFKGNSKHGEKKHLLLSRGGHVEGNSYFESQCCVVDHYGVYSR